MENKYKILLIDNDTAKLEPHFQLINGKGYRLFIAKNAEEGIRVASEIQPQLILIDINLPGMDGVEACIEFRRKQKLDRPIIAIFTTRTEDYSQIAAFNAGADDYIIKPISPRVFLYRIKALLRRYFADYRPEVEKNLGGLVIDRERYLILKEGQEILLPRKEFELLSLLAANPSKVFTRQEILSNVWGYEFEQKNRTIDVHIRKLREKLGDNYIATIKGIGYRFKA
jgi:two-component system, OmpR family, alkaline phosphatase synthesis response regulator PhoP